MVNRPQPTETLVRRLRRVAKALDVEAEIATRDGDTTEGKRWRARANTCLQAAGRLEAYLVLHGETPETDDD